MRHTRGSKRVSDEVTLNMTAMLDMAFQLLAFLILTFRPQAIESSLALRLPANTPVTGPVEGGSDPIPTLEPAAEVLQVTVHSTGDGRLGAIEFGRVQMTGLAGLRDQLQSVFGEPGTPFGQVALNIDPKLHYQHVMQLVDVCSSVKLADGHALTKVGFTELPPEP